MSLKVTAVVNKSVDSGTIDYPCLREGNVSGAIYLCFAKDQCYIIDGTPRKVTLDAHLTTAPFIGAVTLTSA